METSAKTPDLNRIRKILFWDTDFSKINWEKDRKPILKRIFERGNEIEIKEIISFYGKDTILNELKNTSNNFLPSFKENLNKYLLE